MAPFKKNAGRKKQIIVFIDESGLSERPHRVKTWAPKGQTPVLQMSFNWKQLSAIAGMSMLKFYFKLYPGTIRSKQIVEFLRHLKRQIKRRMLIIWDGLRAHRSRLVADYIQSTKGRIQLEFLPAYAPELNPVEFLWAHWKHHELANFCPSDFHQLSVFARKKLRRTQRRKNIIKACWNHAQLNLFL